jgi:hypothetical protein
MKVTKGKKQYVCAILRPGYFETGVLNTFFRGSSHDDGLPAYFWTDNCDYDAVANCYVFSLATLANKEIVEEVYVPREYVLITMIHKTALPSDEEIGKIGFRLAEPPLTKNVQSPIPDADENS